MVKREGTFDVSVTANGDAEKFRARKVEITTHGRTFVIEPGLWGGLWVSAPGLETPYYLNTVRLYPRSIKVGVFLLDEEEALAREEREEGP